LSGEFEEGKEELKKGLKELKEEKENETDCSAKKFESCCGEKRQ